MSQVAKRKLRAGRYRSFRLHKRLKPTTSKLPSAWQLWRRAWTSLMQQRRFFGGIALVYGVLQFVFVRGLSGGLDIAGTKDVLTQAAGEGGGLAVNLTLFSDLLGSTTAGSSEVASLYQTIIIFVCSLAVIWGLRQVGSKKPAPLKVKDAFYKGMYPLVPALLVLLVIALQLLPLTLASGLYSLTVGGGLATTGVEQLLWAVLAILLTTLSLYMIASSILALYIVTLPNVTPLQALRSARQLAVHRRWQILRKLLWLGMVLLVVLGFVILPVIVVAPVVAEFVFYIVLALLLPTVHAYMYNLYRSTL